MGNHPVTDAEFNAFLNEAFRNMAIEMEADDLRDVRQALDAFLRKRLGNIVSIRSFDLGQAGAIEALSKSVEE